MANILGIIPARFASTRLPGKPLIDLNGKTMIQRVYERAMQSPELKDLLIATDDIRIYQHALSFGAKAVMTDKDHASGTDRCREALDLYKDKHSIDFVINIQGDEPLLNVSQISDLAKLLNPDIELASLMSKITDTGALTDPNTVKVVVNYHQEALYFSRSPIPFLRQYDLRDWLTHYPFKKHIGLYAYRKDILEKITQLQASELEISESLEQLRWLENGFRIKMGLSNSETISVDTADDADRVRLILSEEN